MAGQLNHFMRYARETLPYAIKRYEDEVNRLYGVMNTRLADREFLAGRYSIADMACVGWVNLWKRQDQDIDEFPHFKRWLETLKARPAVAARHEARRGTAREDRHEGSRPSRRFCSGSGRGRAEARFSPRGYRLLNRRGERFMSGRRAGCVLPRKTGVFRQGKGARGASVHLQFIAPLKRALKSSRP